MKKPVKAAEAMPAPPSSIGGLAAMSAFDSFMANKVDPIVEKPVHEFKPLVMKQTKPAPAPVVEKKNIKPYLDKFDGLKQQQ